MAATWNNDELLDYELAAHGPWIQNRLEANFDLCDLKAEAVGWI